MLVNSLRASRAARLPHVRSLHVSRPMAALNETNHHKDASQRKSEIDAAKQDQLQKAKQGQGEWKAELASEGEAAVKADREETTLSAENIKKMQKEGEKLAHKS